MRGRTSRGRASPPGRFLAGPCTDGPAIVCATRASALATSSSVGRSSRPAARNRYTSRTGSESPRISRTPAAITVVVTGPLSFGWSAGVCAPYRWTRTLPSGRPLYRQGAGRRGTPDRKVPPSGPAGGGSRSARARHPTSIWLPAAASNCAHSGPRLIARNPGFATCRAPPAAHRTSASPLTGRPPDRPGGRRGTPSRPASRRPPRPRQRVHR